MDPYGNFGLLAVLGGIAGGSAILTVATVAIVTVAAVAVVALAATAITGAVNHREAAQLMSNASSGSSGSASSSSSGRINRGGSPSSPNNNGKKPKKIVKQVHHFLTNKSTRYTPQITEVVAKYKLDLNGDWNKQFMEHLGRHCNKYHDFMLNSIRHIDNEANGDVQIFLDKFQKIKDFIISNPDKLYNRGW